MKCDRCKAEIVVGTMPPHKMRETINGVTRIFTFCAECTEKIAWAHWPEDDWGPFVWKIREPGRA